MTGVLVALIVCVTIFSCIGMIVLTVNRFDQRNHKTKRECEAMRLKGIQDQAMWAALHRNDFTPDAQKRLTATVTRPINHGRIEATWQADALQPEVLPHERWQDGRVG